MAKLTAVKIAATLRRYRRLKENEKSLKSRLETLRDTIAGWLSDGIEVRDNTAQATLTTAYLRTYSVRDALTLLESNPSIDPASILKVSSAGVRALPPELQSQIGFVINTSDKVIVKPY